jgi:serine/threonine protein kinase
MSPRPSSACGTVKSLVDTLSGLAIATKKDEACVILERGRQTLHQRNRRAQLKNRESPTSTTTSLLTGALEQACTNIAEGLDAPLEDKLRIMSGLAKQIMEVLKIHMSTESTSSPAVSLPSSKQSSMRAEKTSAQMDAPGFWSPEVCSPADSASEGSENSRIDDELARSARCPNEDGVDDTFEMINNYVVVDQLGRGSHGIVSIGIHQVSNAFVAIKSIPRERRPLLLCREFCSPAGHPPPFPPHPEPLSAVDREITIMSRLNHPNIASLIEVIDDDTEMVTHIVMEYCRLGPVSTVRWKPPAHEKMTKAAASSPTGQCLSPQSMVETPVTTATFTVVRPLELLRKYTEQIASGLSFMHSKGVVHGDIKPDNILRSSDDTLKISDFGSSFSIRRRRRSTLPDLSALPNGQSQHLRSTGVDKPAPQRGVGPGGTPYFVSPEVFLGEEPSFASDVWAFGVSLFAMLTGRLPFVAPSGAMENLQRSITSDPLSFPPLSDVEANDDVTESEYCAWQRLISSMLSKSAVLRIRAKDILRDPLILPVSMTSPRTNLADAKLRCIRRRSERRASTDRQSSHSSGSGDSTDRRENSAPVQPMGLLSPHPPTEETICASAASDLECSLWSPSSPMPPLELPAAVRMPMRYGVFDSKTTSYFVQQQGELLKDRGGCGL